MCSNIVTQVKKQPQIGTIVSQDIPQLSSLLTDLGFNFIFIDLEHGSLTDNTIASIISSKNDKSKVFIRISTISESNIKHALDLGCDGLIAPRVETQNELQILVDYSYYPPLGKRSVGFSLANKFGLGFKEYTEEFKPILLAQIESTAGLKISNDIISHKSIDGIFMGPYDLSMSMGIPGNFENTKFLDTLQNIRTSCAEHNKLFGTFASNIKSAKHEIEMGCDLIAVGVDTQLLLATYQDIVSQVL